MIIMITIESEIISFKNMAECSCNLRDVLIDIGLLQNETVFCGGNFLLLQRKASSSDC